ncbi:MAG: Type II secretion envelope pseudopilin protein (PulG,guides folded protein to PulD in outer membrane) [uncultured Sulfurovum sp.]|uniref:Type II secretion envelope pseudopilin protein (PulG,guides folded protein to PulD in outer membrane) n=1 Tax=uncultured Sulfurovum sp. TaxID=269237 RepID=A0A6S6S727_9BACT|nr:MAG: Type II secretion envelope pseudopilin protein (PulG,guides folded protein to PulD in outer membrane) [uncultured Sulfurovum sp.]
MTNTNNVQTKKGFTMIELIFVIVIIGILAAVAIPRLAATRDDARVATSLAEITNVVNEMSTFYTANGSYTTGAAAINTLTNTDLFTGNACIVEATQIISGTTYSYCTDSGNGGLEVCTNFTPTDANGTLLVAAGAGNGNVCAGIQNTDAFTDLARTYVNGGSRVRF